MRKSSSSRLASSAGPASSQWSLESRYGIPMDDDGGAADVLHALLRAARTTFDKAPAMYVSAVAEALEDSGVDIFDTSSTAVGASPRARALWFAEGSETRAEWWETDGWSMWGTAFGEPVHAPLAILAAPSSVASWIVDVLAGRRWPSPKAGSRMPTCVEWPGATGVAFERQLLSYGQDIEQEDLPRQVSSPPSPRSGMAWNLPLRHRCLSCPTNEGGRSWTRHSAAVPARVAMSGRTRTAYTGWCLSCHPDQLHMTQAARDQLDAKLIRAHELGRYPGTLLLSGSVERYLCTVCMNPWWLFPGASLPLTHGVLEDIGLRLHPCPWCWEADEAGARAAQHQALSVPW